MLNMGIAGVADLHADIGYRQYGNSARWRWACLATHFTVRVSAPEPSLRIDGALYHTTEKPSLVVLLVSVSPKP
jgi:hypothetical protein